MQTQRTANKVASCQGEMRFFCWSPPVFQDPQPPIVDLNDVLAEKAWKNFVGSRGALQRLMLQRKNVVFAVPEHYYSFEDIVQMITPSKKLTTKTPDHKSPTKDAEAKSIVGKEGTDNSGLLKGKVPHTRELTNPVIVSMDTEFHNETAEQKLCKFHFHKMPCTEIDVSFQKGITLGGKANFSIGIPVGDLEFGTRMQCQVTKSEGQKFKESVVMKVTSNITVGPNSCCNANFQLEKKALHATFKVISRMSMPQGWAPVYIKRKSDGETVFVHYINNLKETFMGAVPCAQVVEESGRAVVDKLDFVIEGIVKGTLVCNRKIVLTSNESEV